jgi:hypothetical protein
MNDGAVGPHGGAFLHEGWANLIHLANFRPGIVDIGKNHGRPSEDAIFQGAFFIRGHC